MRFVSALLPLFVLALAACGSHRPAADDEVDANALAASLGDTRSVAADPALRAALRDPIMSDPMLVSRANADAIRPPVEPYAAPIPVEAPGAATPRADIPAPPALPGGCPQCRAARGALTLAALAESQGGRFATCAATIGYSAGWAMRVALPLVPGARVREAAGSDADGCALRIVSFHSDLPPAALVGWYARAVKGLAHRVDGDDHLLTTDSVRILARPWPGYGSEVILMTSAPRQPCAAGRANADRMSPNSPSTTTTDAVRQFTVGEDDDGIRVDRWFKRHLPDTSFTLVAKWARTGQLRVDGARVGPGDRLAAGQSLRVPPAEAPRPEAAKPKRERAPLSADEIAFARDLVIHRDQQAIVINKPPGLATQGGTKTTAHVDGLLDALQFEAEGRPKLVHRLDKDTSGALLIARTARAAAFFAKSFSGRSARKVYWALVVGVPSIDDGTVDLPIAKQPGTGGEKMQVDEENGQPARSRYRVIERAGNRTCWVELQPFTGRTHQLRVHMAAIGHPIVGDGKYGGAAAFLTGGISRKMHLHARRIRVDHPDEGKVDVTAELPPHFAESLKSLGFDEAAGDRLPNDEPAPPSREQQKARAKAHAKTVRKARRGERRGRGRE